MVRSDPQNAPILITYSGMSMSSDRLKLTLMFEGHGRQYLASEDRKKFRGFGLVWFGLNPVCLSNRCSFLKTSIKSHNLCKLPSSLISLPMCSVMRIQVNSILQHPGAIAIKNQKLISCGEVPQRETLEIITGNRIRPSPEIETIDAMTGGNVATH